jgi:hypothetical protein
MTPRSLRSLRDDAQDSASQPPPGDAAQPFSDSLPDQLNFYLDQINERWSSFEETAKLCALLEELFQGDDIGEESATLKGRFHEVIEARMEAIREEESISGDLLLDLSRLLAFADYFPPLLLFAGEAATQVARVWNGGFEESLFGRGRSVRKAVRSHERAIRRFGVPMILSATMDVAAVVDVAEGFLQRAYEASDPNLKPGAASRLADLLEWQEHYDDAYHWYETAAAAGADVQEALERARERIRAIAEEALFAALDDYLLRGDQQELERVLAGILQRKRAGAILVRLGDLHFCEGDLHSAGNYYQATLQALDQSLQDLTAVELDTFRSQLGATPTQEEVLRQPPFCAHDIPPAHSRTRAFLGLFECARRSDGRALAWCRYETMLSELASARDGARADISRLAGLQSDLRQWEAALLREQAREAREQGRWELCYQALSELLLGGCAVAEDYAWLLVTSDRLDRPKELASLLPRVPVEALCSLPLETIKELLDALLERGYITEVEAYARQLPEHLPEARQWYQSYLERRADASRQQVSAVAARCQEDPAAASATALLRPYILARSVEPPPAGATRWQRGTTGADGGWSAIFGIRLASVWATQGMPQGANGSAAVARLLLILSQHFTHFANVDVVWRYIGQDQRLAIALLFRCRAPSAQEALRQAETLWPTVSRLLPFQDTLYSYEPLRSEAELLALLQPFQAQMGFEVTRRLRTRRRGRRGQSHVLPIVPPLHGADLHLTLQALVQSQRSALLDIHVTPTTLNARERRHLADYLKGSQEDLDNSREELASVTHTLDAMRNHARMAPLVHLLESEQSALFALHIRLATGEADSSLDLPFLAGLELLGSHSRVVETMLPEEIDVLRFDVSNLAGERWTSEHFPRGLERLGNLYTLAEAAALLNPPFPREYGLPGLRQMNVRPKAPPPHLPTGGAIIGESLATARSTSTPTVALADEARERHTCILGRTGTGKSTLMLNMALQDIESGKGVAIIDPHSQLIDRIIARLPSHRLQDVVLFDPSDTQYPLGYNIMDVSGWEEANAVIGDLVATFKKLYDPHAQGIVGPRFENIIRNTMLALFEGNPGSTLVDVMQFIMSQSFRDPIIERLEDPVVKGYWRVTSGQIGSWGEGRGEVVDWVISKFSALVNDLILRPVVGQSRTTLDFRHIMNNRQILLVDLGKGKIGPEVSQFLGLILVSGIFIAALSRARQAPDSYPTFYLYIDEFQNITTQRITQMFSEARKFGLALTVANQHFSQLTEEVRQSIIGNVANWLVFQTGVNDSEYLQSELYPVTREELISLPSYHMQVKLLMEGDFARPFPVRTIPDHRAADAAIEATVRRASQRRYGTHSAIINDNIRKRFEHMFMGR